MRMTNKELFKRAIERQGYKLGCYDDEMQTLHSHQVAKIVDEIEFCDTRDVVFRHCVVEIEVIGKEIDLHYLTKREYERYA